MQEAVSRNEYWRLIDAGGRPPGVLGLWPSRAITFIENHDTGSTLNHWPFPSDHLQARTARLRGTACMSGKVACIEIAWCTSCIHAHGIAMMRISMRRTAKCLWRLHCS